MPTTHPSKPIPFSTIPPQPLHWLWQNHIPRGRLSLLAGDPGTGKTSLLLHLAARLSRGQPPATTATTDITATTNPQATLLLSPEDNPADTLRPRLDAFGANPAHIFTYPHLHTLVPAAKPHDASAATPLQTLGTLIDSIPHLALVAIDPITHFLGLTDRHLPQTTPDAAKTILHALAQLAEASNIAILLTTRLSKSLPARNAAPSINRLLGSLAFASFARTVHILLPFPNRPQMNNDQSTMTNPTHLLIPLKSNLSRRPDPLPFTLADTLTWHDPIPLKTLFPDHAALAEEANTLNENTCVAQAVNLIKKVLADGPLQLRKFEAVMKSSGIAKRTLQRAREFLNVDSVYNKVWDEQFVFLPGDKRPIPSPMQSLKEKMAKS